VDTPNLLRRFWISVFVAVVTLGIACGNWKDPTKNAVSVAFAVIATVAFACSMVVASRFVMSYARVTRRDRYDSHVE
jgi:hypothetical protein